MSDTPQSSEFRGHAVRRKILHYLQRVLLDNTIDSDTPAKEQIICEELPRSESIITQREITFMLDDLQVMENRERMAMNEFAHVRRNIPVLHEDIPNTEAAQTDGEEKAVKGKPAAKRTKRKPPTP